MSALDVFGVLLRARQSQRVSLDDIRALLEWVPGLHTALEYPSPAAVRLAAEDGQIHWADVVSKLCPFLGLMVVEPNVFERRTVLGDRPVSVNTIDELDREVSVWRVRHEERLEDLRRLHERALIAEKRLKDLSTNEPELTAALALFDKLGIHGEARSTVLRIAAQAYSAGLTDGEGDPHDY